VFHLDRDGEPFWTRPEYRSFAEWLREPVQPDRDDGDVTDERD
jgi:hypothetical protein